MNSQKLHVDVVSKYFYPVAAGIETNIIETYAVLARNGWDVAVHASKDILTEKNRLSDTDEVRGLRIRRYPFRWYGYFPQIDWENTDAVCLHNFNVVPHFYIFIYSLWRKILRKKRYILIVTPHGGFTPEWSIFGRVTILLKKTYHYTIGTLLINFVVDRVRAVSDWERMKIIKKGVAREKVITIDNGIEDEAYADLEQEASDEIKKKVAGYGRYIIQIGRIHKIKNFETTIQALAKLPERYRGLKFVVVGPVGDTVYAERLKTLVQKLELEDRVVFCGVIRGVDKFYLIKKAEIMVHMALWESFCNVVHEGLSQGLICIVSNTFALPYLIKDGVHGYCLDTYDVDAVSKKIEYVLDHKNNPFIREMKARNKEYGLENSWRKVAGRMDEMYRSALSHIRI